MKKRPLGVTVLAILAGIAAVRRGCMPCKRWASSPL